jgi:hypothetical protein
MRRPEHPHRCLATTPRQHHRRRRRVPPTGAGRYRITLPDEHATEFVVVGGEVNPLDLRTI